MYPTPPRPPIPPTGLAPTAPGQREVRAEDLLRGSRELVIRLGDSAYRLRLTRNDKLILTK